MPTTLATTVRRGFAVALTAALMASGIAATAGPNDHLHVATRNHIDAPKVEWKGENFNLISEIGSSRRQIENTVNWVGKGYHATKPRQQYIFTVPSDPAVGFLGKPGELLNWGPAVPGSSRDPLWAGFGADADIPVETFRDGNFNLDIIGFSGPGRMEQFNYIDDFSPPERLFSSHDPAYRSQWMLPGMHTHNDTTFTRPGQYEIAYRVTARDTSGKLIASAPQVLRWQVGGTIPSEDGLGDIPTAYNQSAGFTPTAPAEADQASTFSIKPHAERERPGDEYLTDLVFNTGNAADVGTAVFYIDGFYLAEVPVVDGQAVWPEMIGSLTSNFQVVYIPKAGSTARFVSAPLQYQREDSEKSTSTMAENFPTPAPRDPAPAFNTKPIHVSDNGVHVQVAGDGDNAHIAVAPSQDNLVLRVSGGYYKAGAAVPECLIEQVSAPGKREFDVDRWGCDGDDYELKLKVSPHALADVGAALVAIPNQENAGDGTRDAQLPRTPGAEEESPVTPPEEPGEPEPTPGQPEPGEPAKPGEPVPAPEPGAPDPAPGTPGTPAEPGEPAPTPEQPAPMEPEPAKPEPVELLNQPVTIENGHLDFGPVLTADGLDVAVNDDSRTAANASVARTTESVKIKVPNHAKVVRSDKAFGDPSFDFLGAKGDALYVLPENQVSNLPWPGLATTHLPSAEYPQGLNLDLKPVSAPEGGKWFAFTTALGALDDIQGIWDSMRTVAGQDNMHMHLNWAFTKPGVYQIAVRAHGQNAAGEAVETPERIVTFEVAEVDPLTLVLPGKPDEPVQPDEPAVPVQPSAPEQPVSPLQPVAPEQPENPVQPGKDEKPEQRVEPTQPAQPAKSDAPAQPAKSDAPAQPSLPEQINPAGTPAPATTSASSTTAGSANSEVGRNKLPRTGVSAGAMGAIAMGFMVAGMALLASRKIRRL